MWMRRAPLRHALIILIPPNISPCLSSQYAGKLVPGSLRLSGGSVHDSDRVPFVTHFAGCQLCSGLTQKEARAQHILL